MLERRQLPPVLVEHQPWSPDGQNRAVMVSWRNNDQCSEDLCKYANIRLHTSDGITGGELTGWRIAKAASVFYPGRALDTLP